MSKLNVLSATASTTVFEYSQKTGVSIVAIVEQLEQVHSDWLKLGADLFKDGANTKICTIVDDAGETVHEIFLERYAYTVV